MRVLSWTLVVSMLLQQISIPIAFAQTVEEQQPENTISIDEVETEAGILQFGATQEAGAQEKDPEDPYDPKDQSSGGADSAELPSPEPSLTNEDIGQEGSKTEPGEGPGVRSSLSASSDSSESTESSILSSTEGSDFSFSSQFSSDSSEPTESSDSSLSDSSESLPVSSDSDGDSSESLDFSSSQSSSDSSEYTESSDSSLSDSSDSSFLDSSSFSSSSDSSESSSSSSEEPPREIEGLEGTFVYAPSLDLPPNTHPTLAIPKHKEITSAHEIMERIEIRVTDPNGEELDVQGTVTEEEEQYLFTLYPPDNFLPGTYHVTAHLRSEHGSSRKVQSLFRKMNEEDKEKSRDILIFDGDIPWGTIAFNTDRPAYAQWQRAEIQFSILDELEIPQCDKDVTAEVTDPQGNKESFSTQDKTIHRLEDCRIRAHTPLPDYSLEIPLKEQDNYTLKISPESDNDDQALLHTIRVEEDPKVLDVRRTSVTRTRPSAEEMMEISIIPMHTFVGTISERVPPGYEVLETEPLGIIEDHGKKKATTIVWSRRWEAGIPIKLQYTFKSPEDAPIFSLFGPLKADGHREGIEAPEIDLPRYIPGENSSESSESFPSTSSISSESSGSEESSDSLPDRQAGSESTESSESSESSSLHASSDSDGESSNSYSSESFPSTSSISSESSGSEESSESSSSESSSLDSLESLPASADSDGESSASSSSSSLLDTSTEEDKPAEPDTTKDRPHRLRKEEREEMREEHEKSREMGRTIEQLRDAAIDRGEDPTIEKLKEAAETKLQEASDELAREEEEREERLEQFMEGHAAPGPEPKNKLVCFRTDGTVTGVREECDQNQGKHFGIPPHAEAIAPGHGGVPPPFQKDYSDEMEQRFYAPKGPMDGPPLLHIIGEAIHRLGGALEHTQGDAEIESKIRETIVWLSSILAQYGSNEPGAEEREQLAQEIHERLFALESNFGPPGPGGPEDIEHILEKIARIFEKLPQVFAIFEREGITIASEAQESYEEAKMKFQEGSERCKENKQECHLLKEIFEILEFRMRPPMEKAMMASGKIEVIQEIEEIMGEDGPPPDHFGPPPGDFPGPPMMPPGEPYPMPPDGGMPGYPPKMMPPDEPYPMPYPPPDGGMPGYPPPMMPPGGPYPEYPPMPPHNGPDYPMPYPPMPPDGSYPMPYPPMPPDGSYPMPYPPMPPHDRPDYPMPPDGGYPDYPMPYPPMPPDGGYPDYPKPYPPMPPDGGMPPEMHPGGPYPMPYPMPPDGEYPEYPMPYPPMPPDGEMPEYPMPTDGEETNY